MYFIFHVIDLVFPQQIPGSLLKWALPLDFSPWGLTLFHWAFISEATVESLKAYWLSSGSGLLVWEKVRSFGWRLDANSKEWNSAIKRLGTAELVSVSFCSWRVNKCERTTTDISCICCFWKCLLFRLWFIKVEHFKSYKKRPWTSVLDQCWPKCDKFVYILSVCSFELQSKFMHVHEIWVLQSLVINWSMFAEIGEWIKGLFAFLDFLKRKAVWLHLKNTEWFFFGWRLNLVCGLGCHFTRRREASLFAVPMQNEGEMYFDELYFLL